MSAARLPYYQQQTSDQRRRSSSRGRHSSKRRSVERRRHSRSRSRSRSVEQRQQRRRHSREHDRDRDRHRRHHHRDSRDRSWERERDRERDRDSRDYGRRSSNHYQHDTRSRSRSATPPGTTSSASASASSSTARRQMQQQQQQQLLQPQQGIGHNKHKQMTDPRMLPTSVPGKKDNAMSAVGAYYNLDTDEPFDKERIHREIEEKLRETLAREGKVYPPPKAEPSHPVFANDGSFMELFKKMQEEQQRPQHHQHQHQQQHHQRQLDAATAAAAAAAAAASAAIMMSDQPQHHQHHQQQQHPQHPDVASPFGILPAIAVGAASSAAAPYIAAAAAGKSAPPPPMVGRRRGGKILKTGVVAKLKTPNERDVDPKDFWSLYLAEVNKYKSNACDTDNGKRPLVNDKSSADIMSAYKMETAPFDPRFPNQNVTRYCYQSYVDFHRCQKKRGEDFAPCNYFKKVYKTMCPNAWVEKWDDQRESGTFPGRI